MGFNIDREALEGVSGLFVERWSPRALKNDPIDDDTLTRLFEAARWSPSCFNDQPWHFYLSSDSSFEDFLGLLMEGNQGWAKNAAHIGFLVGRKHFNHNGKPNSSYQLDCGAAWMAMTLQARMEGLYTHGMAGIDRNAIHDYFKIDTDKEEVLMGFALGKIGDKNQLPEAMREREKPSDRKPLNQVWSQPTS